MTILTTVLSHPKLTIVVSVSAALLAAAYLAKWQLNNLCPRVPLSSLPPSSAIRNLISTAEEHTTPSPPWGLTTSPLLASWSSSSMDPSNNADKTSHTIHSFLALQTTIPITLLSNYPPATKDDDNHHDDTYPLTQALLSSFLSARSTGPEARFFLDVDVPPLLSFSPGAHLFGRSKTGGVGAFLLGTWGTARQLHLPKSVALPADVPRPATSFPSNKAQVVADETDAAGAVMYWRAPAGLVEAVDRLAARGMPWRMMEGGYQEWMVERVSEEEARVTYVTVETGGLYPGGHGEGKMDWKKIPGWMYELHVVYGQWLLWKTLRQLRHGGDEKRLRRS